MGIVRYLLKGAFEHFSDLVETRIYGERITDDLTIEEVHDWRQVDFLTK